ncbi:ATP-binding cassette domain-containing protein [Lacisediminihabitans profunda]|uniref:ATP-binding cassette domain-containing protein n=1 Tax=Lacisediminihabitans profunda TaxID=2594790 RepID=UPI00319DB01D
MPLRRRTRSSRPVIRRGRPRDLFRRSVCPFVVIVLRRAGTLATKGHISGERLSGGAVRKVAVARTLLTRADVVLLDEPTALLDEESADELIADLVVALRDRVTVLVTHQATAGIPSANRLDLGRGSTVLPTAQSGLVVSGAA